MIRIKYNPRNKREVEIAKRLMGGLMNLCISPWDSIEASTAKRVGRVEHDREKGSIVLPDVRRQEVECEANTRPPYL